MVTTETTVRKETARPPVAARLLRRRWPLSAEVTGYLVVAIGLAALLWRRASQVDAFYLDEWFYVHGAEYMWHHLPGAILGTIPEWNRGPQRAYSFLLGGPWTIFGTSTAYTLTHMMNVALLVSGIIPAALFARRVIRAPLLRVLAVALAVAVPWLTISAHLLTENLAFPVFIWAIYLIVRTAEAPSFVNQCLALASIALLGLVRLNLAPMLVVLVAAVVVTELRDRRRHRGVGFREWLWQALRREALVAGAFVISLVVAIQLLSGGSESLGAYGGFTFKSIGDGLFGANAHETRYTMLSYAHSLVVGSFVIPMALGLGTALAALFGRLGRAYVIPAVTGLGGFAIVLTGVSIWTAGNALEDRYVFYAYAPVAIFAVAGLEHLPRLRRWVAAGGLLTLWALITGYAPAALDAGNFFASPPGAFWTRVVTWRLEKYESKLLGWTFLGRPGWLLVAIALALLVWAVSMATRFARGAAIVIGVVLAGCLLLQVVSLDYDYKQELYGTRDVPGGIALRAGHDREDWIDPLIPDGQRAGVVPGVVGIDTPFGGQERISFWNRDITVTVGTPWNSSPVPAPPGFSVIKTFVGTGGIARWKGTLPTWLAVFRDDPRIQFAGRLVARSTESQFALNRTRPSGNMAMWTGSGLDGDGALLKDTPARFVLVRADAPRARTVTLQLHAPGAPTPVHWKVTRDGKPVRQGRLAPTADALVRLPIPPCSTGSCGPVTWRMSASGTEVPTSFPVYGAPGPSRPLLMYVQAAAIR